MKMHTRMAVTILGIVSATTQAQDSLRPWPDTPQTRLEALALLETLNADLLGNDSATLTLDRWCSAHQMANPAKVAATRIHDAEKQATDETRKLLNVSPTEPVGYRHVQLHCGD